MNTDNDNDENTEPDEEPAFSFEIDPEYFPFVMSYLQEIMAISELNYQIEAFSDQIAMLEAQKLIKEVSENLWQYE